jgi:hypothetical protein
MSLNADQQGLVDLWNDHTATVLPIGRASGFPEKRPAKKILVYIFQRLATSFLVN